MSGSRDALHQFWFGPATPFHAVTEGLCLGACPQVYMAVGLDPGVPGGYEAVRRIVPLRGRREQTEVVLPEESALGNLTAESCLCPCSGPCYPL